MKLEIFAALVATTLVQFVLAAAMFAALFVYKKRIPGTKYWFAAAVATAMGHGAYLFAAKFSPFAEFLVPNVLLATGIVTVTAGTAVLSGRKTAFKRVIVLESAAIILFLIFAVINPAFYIRGILISAICFIGAVAASAFLFFPTNPSDRPVTIVGGTVFTIFSLLSAGRLIAILINPPIQGVSDAPIWYGLFMYVSLVLYVALGIVFYLMVGGLLNRSLERSLHENTLLLSEIRHRTKNNLALIGSLISLQENDIDEPIAKAALRDVGERISTITTVYHMLSRVEDGHEADTKLYLDSLAGGIRDSIIADSKEVEFRVHADACMLDANHLVSLGLIVNELATNSLKYAFPDNRSGVMRLEFRLAGSSRVLLFSDNGIGMGGKRHSEGLGLTLVRTLAAQLRGNLKLESEPGKGTSCTLEFPA